MELATWMQAVQDDGQFVMQEVTNSMYEGGYLRPDAFYANSPNLGLDRYRRDFDARQRKVIESCDQYFDMFLHGPKFDVSLHRVLQGTTCGLQPWEKLNRLLANFQEERNQLCHPSQVSDVESNILGRLDDLLLLYLDILETLERRQGRGFAIAKLVIRQKIEEKKERHQQEIPWDIKLPSSSGVGRNIAIGASVGIGALALGALVKAGLDAYNASQKKAKQEKENESQKKQEKEKKSESGHGAQAKEECSVM